MTDTTAPTGEAQRPPVTAQKGLLQTLISLWPYIWPGDRADLKMRVVWAMVLLVVAKLATVAVPFTFKWATDALAGHPSAPVFDSSWMTWVVAAPVARTGA